METTSYLAPRNDFLIKGGGVGIRGFSPHFRADEPRGQLEERFGVAFDSGSDGWAACGGASGTLEDALAADHFHQY